MNDKSNMIAVDNLVKEIWVGWEEREPDLALLVRIALADGIASIKVIEESDPPRYVAYLIYNDKRPPLELLAIDVCVVPPRLM